MNLRELALVGSRARGFHHDVASKLQGLMMALDEISEHAAEAGDAVLERAAEAAFAATKDIHGMLQAYRTLARPPAAAPASLRALVEAASKRANASLVGEVPDVQITTSAPVATQALALCIETLGGARSNRSARIACTTDPLAIELRGDGPYEVPLADVVAIASCAFPAELVGDAIVIRP